jgi:hypothetical protein
VWSGGGVRRGGAGCGGEEERARSEGRGVGRRGANHACFLFSIYF